jgi:hypothetical protein
MPDTKESQAARDKKAREDTTGNPEDTSARKSSGERATADAKTKRDQEKAREEKAAKKAAEEQAAGRRSPTEPAAPVPDPEGAPSDMVVAGHELREGVEEPKATKAQAKREDKAFADPDEVDVFEVAGDTSHVVVRIDNKGYRFDTQQALALRRLLDAAAINLNF